MSANNLIALNSEVGLTKYLRQIKAIPMLSEEEEYSLSRKWVDEADIEAAQKLVLSHMKLVVKVAQKFKGYGLPMMDLISEGNIGLMRAVKKFNPEMGYRLATYAIWWIKATIQDYILKSWSMVKIGTSAIQKKLFFNLKKVKQNLLKSELHESADINTLAAEKLGVSKSRVEDMSRSMSGEMISLHESIGDDDDNSSELLDFIASSENAEETVIELHDKNIMLEKLAASVDKLSEREREIIKARRLSDEPETLENLSAVYGVSRERIRQIEERAMDKLKGYLGAYALN
ncbi:MAG: RNA polymerase sigma factor RpoH [Candidatus Midichloria mitochondrii]|uniref:RNA polymerase sigma factor n=1 Tax=Midichloria mitochondrii (strain IricVA) TaxID=696127 RepID=F7XWH7_MIDMI|nr:RNA polymerase sigma factor RpoH [Candidatus Midichloria mitochondrii]AEI89026.1 DNA-directed RNA polymerase subunit H [Candidatus Midichloria mitochondrii IricVA]MDJ1255888.1 RNA polymerase sigma factor RpoH [Candidatus Midichloria mitochondrii]MDJ1287627.1 RNA polymerase sigma factor RpoH [Candidatus Midichloria mitochondrii]MDJ1298450.1 RNA polymerase sigma factor RpoH [Candidatus Midichloria mitochondrii]MDJ1312553.1 RNA polymerase sigma factor RpoH [Candidatus Midichloria mitochondrii]